MTSEEASIEVLRLWSHVLLWISVVLPVLAALAVGARYYVDKYEKELVSRASSAALQKAQDELRELRAKTAPRTVTRSQREAMSTALDELAGHPLAFACRFQDGESCDLQLNWR